MAELRLAATSAWAQSVAPGLGEDPHDLIPIAAMPEQVGHDPHEAVDVGEEGLVPRTQVVQPGLPARCEGEAVLRALAVTGEANGAFLAVLGKRAALRITEGPLLGGGQQLTMWVWRMFPSRCSGSTKWSHE